MLISEESASKAGTLDGSRTVETGDMKMLPKADAPEPNCKVPACETNAQHSVGGARPISLSNHRSAETPTAGMRGLRSATVQVLAPKLRLAAVMPEAEYPCHSCVVMSLPRAAPVGKKYGLVLSEVS